MRALGTCRAAAFGEPCTTDIRAVATSALAGDVASQPRPRTGCNVRSDANPRKSPYPAPLEHPTQTGPDGIRFDCNRGARVVLPQRARYKWRVRLRDLDTGNVLFQTENQGALVASAKRYYVRFGIGVGR